jgi:hypothetical protein
MVSTPVAGPTDPTATRLFHALAAVWRRCPVPSPIPVPLATFTLNASTGRPSGSGFDFGRRLAQPEALPRVRFILARRREAPARIRRALLKVCFPPG